MHRQIKNLERRLPWFNREAVTNDLFQEIIDDIKTTMIYSHLVPDYLKEADRAGYNYS